MKESAWTLSPQVKKITAISTVLAFGFAMVTSSALSIEPSNMVYALGYFGVRVVSTALAILVIVLTLVATYNSQVPLRTMLLTGGCSTAGLIAGLYVNFLPNMTWILFAFIMLTFFAATILGKELGNASKRYNNPPTSGFPEID